jgi:hypothetical protein
MKPEIITTEIELSEALFNLLAARVLESGIDMNQFVSEAIASYIKQNGATNV